MNEYPVIKCLPREGLPSMMRFWCPYCKEWHYHGKGDGHRVAHCVEQSPYKNGGYVIKMMSKAELRDIRKAIDDYLKLGAASR